MEQFRERGKTSAPPYQTSSQQPIAFQWVYPVHTHRLNLWKYINVSHHWGGGFAPRKRVTALSPWKRRFLCILGFLFICFKASKILSYLIPGLCIKVWIPLSRSPQFRIKYSVFQSCRIQDTTSSFILLIVQPAQFPMDRTGSFSFCSSVLDAYEFCSQLGTWRHGNK